jgi:hypothetical protein
MNAIFINLRPLSVRLCRHLCFRCLSSLKLLSQMKPSFAKTMFVRISTEIPHFVLIPQKLGRHGKFFLVLNGRLKCFSSETTGPIWTNPTKNHVCEVPCRYFTFRLDNKTWPPGYFFVLIGWNFNLCKDS